MKQAIKIWIIPIDMINWRFHPYTELSGSGIPKKQ